MKNKTKKILNQAKTLLIERKKLIKELKNENSEFNLEIAKYTMKEEAKDIIALITTGKSTLFFISIITKIPYRKPCPPEIRVNEAPGMLGGPTLVRVAGDIYFVGGFTGTQSSNQLSKLSVEDLTKSLVKLQPMKIARHDIAATQACRLYLYSISGSVLVEGREVYTNECEVYDIRKDKWSHIPPVNVATGVAGAYVFNDRYIFLYGGYISTYDCTNRFETYDILDSERGWTLWKSFKLPVDLHPGAGILMYQVSANEIIINVSDKVYFGKVSQDKIVDIKDNNCNNNRHIFTHVQMYNGRVYWVARSRLYCYDMFKKNLSYTQISLPRHFDHY